MTSIGNINCSITRSDSTERFCAKLATSGLLASFAADWIKSSLISESALEGGLSMSVSDMVMPIQWSLSTGYALFAIILAGFLVGLQKSFSRAGMDLKIAYFGLLIWSLFIYVPDFISGFFLNEFIYFKGPASWLSCTAIFLGASDYIWNTLKRTLKYLVFLATLLTAYSIATSNGLDRVQLLRELGGYVFLMQYLVLWWFLSQDKKITSFKIITPMIILVISAFLIITRSLILTCGLYFIAKIYIDKRSSGQKNINIFLLYAIGAILFFSGALYLLFISGLLSSSFENLAERLDEDTRSDQYVVFFSQVDPSELILGKGSRATWFWQGGDYGSIDGSYTLMAFIGGLPLVLTYTYILVNGPFRVLKSKILDRNTLAAATCCFFWALALTGFGIYSAPEAKFSHYILMIFSGRSYFVWKRFNDNTPLN